MREPSASWQGRIIELGSEPLACSLFFLSVNLALVAYMHALCELGFKRVTSELNKEGGQKMFNRLDVYRPGLAKGPCFLGSWFSPAGSLLFVLARI